MQTLLIEQLVEASGLLFEISLITRKVQNLGIHQTQDVLGVQLNIL